MSRTGQCSAWDLPYLGRLSDLRRTSQQIMRGSTWIELDGRIAQNAELGRCWLGVCRAERVLNGSGSTVRNATTNCCARSHTRTQRVGRTVELGKSRRTVDSIQRRSGHQVEVRTAPQRAYFSCSIVTATAPIAESRTLFPSISATRLRSTK